MGKRGVWYQDVKKVAEWFPSLHYIVNEQPFQWYPSLYGGIVRLECLNHMFLREIIFEEVFKTYLVGHRRDLHQRLEFTFEQRCDANQ